MIFHRYVVDSSAVRFLTEVALAALKVKEKEKEEVMRWREEEDGGRQPQDGSGLASDVGLAAVSSTTPVASSAARPAPGRALHEKEKRREKKKSRRSSSIRLPTPGLAFSLWSRGAHTLCTSSRTSALVSSPCPMLPSASGPLASGLSAAGGIEGAWALNTDDLWQQCVNRKTTPGTMCVSR